MWDEIQIQCSDAYEIAEAIINGEVTLTQLKSIPAFAVKADLTEEGVWDLCQSRQEYQPYLDIYPNGKHKQEVGDLLRKAAADKDEKMWKEVLQRNDMAGYLEYYNTYPQGIHAPEVDDKVWNVVLANGAYGAYLTNFPNGKHAAEARIKQAEQVQEDEVWKVAKNNDTPESYQGYLGAYPQGSHVIEANNRIAELMAGQKEGIIRALEENRNAYRLSYIKACGITKNDLIGRIKDSKGNVRNEVLNSWNMPQKNLSMGHTPMEIPAGSTEVYFWGVPSSGKTCAMAAILSMANQFGYFEPREGEGLGYMTELSTAFTSEPGFDAVALPERSPVESTQYLPLTLNETVGNEIREHKLSLVEISGEIFECFAYELQGKPFKTEKHKETYEQLKSYLMDKKNPKYHFFILDSQPAMNSNQVAYLQQAALFFKSREIFDETTQGISLIVTKSDVLSPDRDKWVECATQSAQKHFGSLVTSLKRIVGPPANGGLGLSDGKLKVIPLSIGEVFFKSLCIFDPEPARVLIDLLIEYAKVGESNSWISRLKRAARK